MAGTDASGYVVDVNHPEIMRGILERILATGDVIGTDTEGRTVLAVSVDDWLFDEFAGFGADLEDDEPDPDECGDPAEDEEG